MTDGRANRRWTALRRGAVVFAAALALGLLLPAAGRADAPAGAAGVSAGAAAPALSLEWTLLAGFLVFFMQVGFAMLETGMVRARTSRIRWP